MSMDIPFTDCRRLPRRLPSSVAIAALGRLAARRSTRRYAPETCNINLIVAGAGFVEHAGQRRVIEAPAGFCAWPGEFIAYGPDQPGNWREVYLNFPAAAIAAWEGAGVALRANPLWPIRDLPSVEHRVRDIEALLADPAGEVDGDRLDRLVELLVLEARFNRAREPGSGPPARVAALRRRIERDLAYDWSTAELAEAYGEPLSTFRRHWLAEVGRPPARYLAELRIEEACRQLVETDRPIQAIASAVGFEDPLYFSRKFRQATGETPSAYRRARCAGVEEH